MVGAKTCFKFLCPENAIQDGLPIPALPGPRAYSPIIKFSSTSGAEKCPGPGARNRCLIVPANPRPSGQYPDPELIFPERRAIDP